MHTEGVVLRHLDWMRVRNLSRLTIESRHYTVMILGRWLEGPILYASHDQLAAWQVERSRQVSPATRRNDLTNVREFYRWANREGFRTDDPTARLLMPRSPRRFPRPIDDDKLVQAFAVADPPMAAILGLAAFAGLRACEIARLDWSEVMVTANPPILHVVRGKGDRSRMVPLAPALVELLQALPYRHGPVIRRADGGHGHTAANAVTKRASAFLHDLGHPETLHALRHRFATAAYRVSRDIRAVQDLLGHASPTTTSIYAAVSPGVTVATVAAASDLRGRAA